MPIFEDGDPMDNTEFARQQRQLDAKLARQSKQRHDEILALHKAMYGDEEKDDEDELGLAGAC